MAFNTDMTLMDWAEEWGNRYPILLDDSGRVERRFFNAELYGGSIPAYVLLDRDFSVLGAHTGGLGAEEFAELIEDFLAN